VWLPTQLVPRDRKRFLLLLQLREHDLGVGAAPALHTRNHYGGLVADGPTSPPTPGETRFQKADARDRQHNLHDQQLALSYPLQYQKVTQP